MPRFEDSPRAPCRLTSPLRLRAGRGSRPCGGCCGALEPASGGLGWKAASGSHDRGPSGRLVLRKASTIKGARPGDRLLPRCASSCRGREAPGIRLVWPRLPPLGSPLMCGRARFAVPEAHTPVLWGRVASPAARVPRRLLDRATLRSRATPSAGSGPRVPIFHCLQAGSRGLASLYPSAGALDRGPCYLVPTFWDMVYLVLSWFSDAHLHRGPQAACAYAPCSGVRDTPILDASGHRAGFSRAPAFPWRTIRGQECSLLAPGTARIPTSTRISPMRSCANQRRLAGPGVRGGTCCAVLDLSSVYRSPVSLAVRETPRRQGGCA